MHDFYISQQIAREVIKKAKMEKASQVTEINIKLGELTHLNPDQLMFWLKQLFRETLASGAKIIIAKVPFLIKCKNCGYEGKLQMPKDYDYYFYFLPPFSCPRCGEQNGVEIKSGRECVLEGIKIRR